MRSIWIALLLSCCSQGASGPGIDPWEILTRGAAEESAIRRAQAIAAIGTMRTVRADKLVEAAVNDKDSTVRLAAVNALAERKSRASIPQLKRALDDESGEVSFRAAKGLWELGDRTGEDLLRAVLAGERR